MSNTTMTDAELDRDWTPNGRRPMSTVARTFSQELMDIFRIDDSVPELDQKVNERRENVGKTNQELADLEARLQEMEDRLRRSQAGQSVPQPTQRAPAVPPPPPPKEASQHNRASQHAPSSAKMPPTPGASEGDYYLVTRADLDDSSR